MTHESDCLVGTLYFSFSALGTLTDGKALPFY